MRPFSAKEKSNMSTTGNDNQFSRGETAEGRRGELTVDAVDAQLLLLLDQVGPADEANGNLLAELLEELEHLRRHKLYSNPSAFVRQVASSSKLR